MYRSILILLLYFLYQDGTKAMECNTFHKQNTGRINALSANNVSHVSRCQYEIKTDVTKKTWLRLRWERFSVGGGKMPDCDGGRVEIYTGCNVKRKVATFCSKNLRSKPHDIYSPDNCIKIVFNNRNRLSRGFIASWKSSPYSTYARFPGISCSFWRQKVTMKSVVVGSPRWPSRYSAKTCSWTFRTGDTGLRYVYNIMDMDMFKDPRGCDNIFSDNVYIKGEKSLTTKRKPEWYYCKYTSVDTNEFDTQYYEIDVNMKIRRDRPDHRGFVIGLVAYEDEVARALSSWGSLVGGIIVAVIAIIFVFCCYRRWRRRQLTESRPLVVNPQHLQPAVAPVPQVPQHGSYPQQQPVGYPPPPPPGAYPQQLHAPGGYAPPPSGYPPPPVYSDKPPEYQPPPYEPPQGDIGMPYPPPAGTGSYPAAPYPPQAVYQPPPS